MNNSECIKLEIAEVEDYSLGPEYSDVDVKHILRNATREGRFFFCFQCEGKRRASSRKQVAVG